MTIPLTKSKFPMCINNPVTCLDKDSLFIQSGVTVVASSSGIGKTTWLQEKSEQWRSEGFEVTHFNYDQAPTYGKEMHTVPMCIKDHEEFLELLMEEATKTDIIILDSFKALLSYLIKDVESNADVLPMMQSFRSLCAKTGISIILVHHTYINKQHTKPIQHFYGSRAIEEQCDSAFIFNRTGNKMTAQIVKSRAGLSRDAIIDITQ